MDVREKLIEILRKPIFPHELVDPTEAVADYLLDSGVTVHESSCPYCCDNGEGHGMLKHSYDDEDGMEMSIHPSTRKENGYQSQAWCATVHFRGECRDFYIEVCPFCGRRLVPLKEERETAMPPAAERRMIMPKNVVCKKCNNLVNDWCEKVIDSPDQDMQRDCRYFCEKTNADRIRAMSDEELAEFLTHINPTNCQDCAFSHGWRCQPDRDDYFDFEKCKEGRKRWLKQPAEGE